MNATVILKQTGIETYCSQRLFNVIVRRNDTIRVSAEDADYLLSLNRPSENDGVEIAYYIEQGSNTEVTYDFVAPNVADLVAKRPGDTDAIADAARKPVYPKAEVKSDRFEEDDDQQPVDDGGESEQEPGAAPAPTPAPAPARKTATQRSRAK